MRLWPLVLALAACSSSPRLAPVRAALAEVEDDETLRVWVLGDTGNGSPAQYAVRDAMRRFTEGDRPDLILHAGDVAYTAGRAEELQAFFFDVYAVELKAMPVFPALGNHDVRSSDSETQAGPYFDAFELPARGELGGIPSGTEAYYSFDAGAAHFVVLDSAESDLSPGGPMLRWLRDDLEATRARWIVAIFHHPPYSRGTHDSNVEAPSVRMRENFLPVLEAAGVDLVISGHSHGYERTWPLQGAYETPVRRDGHIRDPSRNGPYAKGVGTIYLVAGHGGAGTGGPLDHPLVAVDGRQHGSVLLEISTDELRVRNVLADGSVADDFTIHLLE